MTERQVFRKEPYQSRLVVLVTVLALCGVPLRTVPARAASAGGSYKVIPLTNLPAERGRDLLGRLRLGTVSKLPGTNALLVTAPPADLQKAVAILDLVDTRTEFDIKDLGPAAGSVAANPQIAAVVGGVSIGTFAQPPQDRDKMRAIVDVHNGRRVVIAPAFQMDDIKLAVEKGLGAVRQRRAPAQPAGFLGDLKQPAATAPSSTGGPASQASHSAASLRTPEPARPSASESVSGRTWAGGSGRLTEGARQSDLSLLGSGLPTASFNLEVVAGEPTTTAVPPAPVAPPAAPVQPQTRPAAVPGNPPFQKVVPASPSGIVPLAAPVATAPAAPRAETRPSAYRPPELPNGDELLDLTLQEKMPIIQLLDLVGKYLGLSYVYNPQDVQGDISLKLNGELHGKIRVNQLYPLLEQSLRQANLVTTRHKGNVVSIVPVTRALEIDPVLIDPGTDLLQAGDTVVTTKFELKYIETTAAKNLLDGLKLGLDVTPLPEKHLLIVTTYAYRMERIQKLLAMVDQPGEPKQFHFRQLRYTMAKTLADKVKAMAEQMLETVSVTVAEPDATTGVARNPGESDIAYRTRLAQIRAQQTALRQQQALARAQLGQETKPSVYLDADERTNRVLMIGAEKQLAVVEQLVDALDVEQQDLRALQLYRMKHVDADDVARKLYELGVVSKLPDSLTGSRYGTSTTRITQPLPGQPRPATPTTPETQVAPATEVTEKGLVEEPQVVVVEATNSLLVNATAEQHAKIAHIVEYVDSETLTDEIPYKIYPLENSSPDHLAEVLENLIQDTVEQQKEGGKIEKVVVNRDEKIKIVPDPNTYSLIVYGNKRNQEWISTLITQLDKRRPQVLIDVTLVAITNHDKFDYDLSFIRSSPNLTSTSGVTNVTSSDTTMGRAVQLSGGGLSFFYGDRQIQALLDTIQSKTYGRVLAKPKLLVNDNENGRIDAKDITYVETTSALPVSTGVPGTTGGLVQTSTSFQEYDAGVMLDITPHISEGDLLRLDIKLTRSDFGTILGDRPPDKKSSEVETAVTLPNGTTVILGGLVKLNQTKGGSKVPILGDIPLFGGLFRTVHNSADGENLYMFVKAEIIRPDEAAGHGMKGLETLSERNRQAFEKHELAFQQYQDWPGVKPTRVDPSKVLDAQ